MHRTQLISSFALVAACTSVSAEPERHDTEPEAARSGRELGPAYEPSLARASDPGGRKCVGLSSLAAESCPQLVDHATGAFICPEEALERPEPRTQTQTPGPCPATRVETLGYGVGMLVSPSTLETIRGCADEKRCAGWQLCVESQAQFGVEDWAADYIGWAIAPERGFFRGDGSVGAQDLRTCRPYDQALWIEGATLLARVSGLPEGEIRAETVDLSVEYEAIRTKLAAGCSFTSVESGDQWWIPATVAFNNAGLTCMPENADGLRTANICRTDKLGECYLSRQLLSTIVGRMIGELPLATCEPIAIETMACAELES